MISVQTILKVADNTGAKKVMCIRVLGGSSRRFAYIGDLIKVSIKESLPNSKVNAGEVHSALVVRTKYGLKRKDGSVIRFSDNSVVLLNSQLQFFGTRVFGSVTREIRIKFSKIASLAYEVL